jgi:hypothetical protein
LEMHLCADTVDGVGVGLVDPVDEADHSVDLGVDGVEVVVVDVEAVDSVSRTSTFMSGGEGRKEWTYTALGSALRAAWKAIVTKDSPRTRLKTLLRRVPFSSKISLKEGVSSVVSERLSYNRTCKHPTDHQ